MRIGVVSEPPRIGSPIKICLKQLSNLSRRHSLFLVIQERNLGALTNFFGGLLMGASLIRLNSIPFLSPILDAVSKIYRTMEWGEVEIDFASLIINSVIASRWLSSVKCERLLCHSTLAPLSVLDLYARSSIRKVLHLHDVPIHVMMKQGGLAKDRLVVAAVKRFESWVISKADAIICTTNYAAKSWRDLFGVKTQVIHPGCDPSRVFPYPKKDYVLSLSSWAKGRGSFFLLDLFESLKNSEMKLIIAGSWPDSSEFERLRIAVSKKGLQRKVFLVQNLSENAIIELYRGARCFISPPIKGPFLMTSLEAASQGTPIIFPSGASAWEIFTSGVHGFKVTVGDRDSYIESVSRFEEDETVRRLGYSIWKRSKEFSWARHVEKLEKILE